MMVRSNVDLLWELVKTSFKMRYQNSILGFLWVLIKPYTMFLVLYLIFSNIVRSSVDNYALYLLIGVVFITFINELLVLGQLSLLERSQIILKVNFPRYIAIISALIGAVINLLINLVLIIALILIAKIDISIVNFFALIFVIVTVFIWGIAIAFFTSILTVRIRDLKNIIELGMFVMQYATPVFYSLDDALIPDGRLKTLISINPLTILMNQMRAALGVYGEFNLWVMTGILLLGLATLIITYIFFESRVKKIAEYF